DEWAGSRSAGGVTHGTGACDTAGVLADARLYLVTPALEPGRLQALLDGGVDLVQLRMKDAGDAAVLREAAWMREACAAAGVPFLVNDRPDLALAAGADGVHVGQDDTPVADVRAAVGPERIVGLSTHAPEQLASAPAEADYVAVGPVWATPTKPGRAAAGIAYVAHAARAARDRPWFAIGGIDTTNVRDVVEAGARRIVVVRALVEAPDPAQAAATLKAALLEAPVGLA
ncbi:MAG: thiamine-phosphate pyrophosphorylase, partial [Solirubrobacterales bacterium]|nr:thiamine-phosphate pyrophosphorylase [Solirubrobacterales bacterium]